MRTPRCQRTWIVLLLSVLAASAGATSGDWVEVACPVCANPFEAWEAKSTNTFGGVDRDLCEHALGDQVFLLGLATCPKCLFTGFLDDFTSGALPAAQKDRLGKEGVLQPLAPIDPGTRRTTDIPAFVRWDLYCQVLSLGGDVPPLRLADAWLQRGRTQRFVVRWPEALREALGDLLDAYGERLPGGGDAGPRRSPYDEAVLSAAALEADAGNPDLPITRTERLHRHLAAAWLWKSRGEDPEAARVLAALRAKEGKLPATAEALALDLDAAIARERESMERAVPFLEQAVGGPGAPDADPSVLRYLLGEVLRKLGRNEQALALLDPLLASDLPEGFRRFVEEAVRKTRAAAASR